MMPGIRQICPELAIKARDELHEVEHRIPDDIIALRGWIEKQPHLKARTNDQFLLTFLRGAKYSLEKAKQKIDYYYTIKSLSPELFLHNQIDDKALSVNRLGIFVPLPKPLKPDGPRLHITHYRHADLSQLSFADLCKHQLRILEIQLQEDDNSVIGGSINIVDMGGISLSFLLKFDPMIMKKFGVFADKAIPLRIKGAHFVNVPREAVAIINICRSLMPKKLQDRMVFHSSMESLYEHIPKEYLPIEYGGNNGCIQDSVDIWEKRFLENREFFEEELQYGTNEKLRVGTKFSSESLFGLEGSFRKLEVD